MSFLTEAFKELELVESKDFSLDKKGTEKLKDFIDNDVEIDFIPVVDPDMDDSMVDTADGVHVGMTILGCEVCNTLHYEDTDNLDIDDEKQLVNVGQPCPHCFSTDGFKIIGTVAPYEDITVDVIKDGEDNSSEDVEVKVDGKEIEKKEVNESLGSWVAAKKLQKMQNKGPKNGEDLEARKDKMDRLKMRAKAGAVKDNEEKGTKANATQKVLDKVTKDAKAKGAEKGRQTQKTNRVNKNREDLIKKLGAMDEADLIKKMKSAGFVAESLKLESPYLDTRFDSRKSFYNKARINDENDALYSYETKVMEMVDGKPVLTVGENLLSQTTLRHIKEWLKQKGFPAESKQQILRDYSNKVEEALNESPMVDLSDEEYAKVMKDREASKPVDEPKGRKSREDIMKSLKDKRDRQQQADDAKAKREQDELDSLIKQAKNLSGRVKEIMNTLDECSQESIVITGDIKYPSSCNSSFSYVYGDKHEYITLSNRRKWINKNTGYAAHTLADDQIEIGCGFYCYARVYLNTNCEIVETHQSPSNYREIDLKRMGLRNFIDNFDKFEDAFYNRLDEVANSPIKESLKNRLNKKALVEKKQKTTDDLTDDDIFSLVYDKLTAGGPQNTQDEEGNKTTPRLNLGVGYNVEDVGTKENDAGINCIVINAKSKEELTPAIDVATYYDCLYDIKEPNSRNDYYRLFIDYGSGDLEKLLADEGKPFAMKKKGEKLDKSQVYGTFKSPLPAQTGLRKNGKLDLGKTQAGDPNESEILVEENKTLKEGMEDISITTDDTVIKVKATPRTDKETIVPPVEEPIDSVEEVEELPEEIPEEIPSGEEEMDIDIETVDEEGIDELGESYLKRVYDNVNSFKTTNGSIQGNKIILEGIIGFKSGKKAKTSFILEAKEMTKKGRVRFVGMNESISKNKSAYTLTGKVENKKLMIESFNYNYLGKDAATGKSKKLYGTIRSKKS